MDKITKALRKLQTKDQRLAELIIERLILRQFTGLNIIKLKGNKGLFRVRAGRLRIIFRLTPIAVIIEDVGLRNENTYKNI